MSHPKTSKASLNVIFSQVLADGATRFDSPPCQITSLAGRVRRRASLSAPQVSNSANLTSDTLLQLLCVSSRSAALQSSLGSRLQQQLENTGSMIYSMSWKEKVTSAGRPYCPRVASVPRTSVTDFSLVRPWATPTTRAHKDTGDLGRSFFRMDGRMRNDTLYRQMWLHAFGLDGSPTREQMAQLEACQPDLARQLMGYPPEWDVCAVMVTP